MRFTSSRSCRSPDAPMIGARYGVLGASRTSRPGWANVIALSMSPSLITACSKATATSRSDGRSLMLPLPTLRCRVRVACTYLLKQWGQHGVVDQAALVRTGPGRTVQAPDLQHRTTTDCTAPPN